MWLLLLALAGAQTPETRVALDELEATIEEVEGRMRFSDPSERVSISLRLAEQREALRVALFATVDEGVESEFVERAVAILRAESARAKTDVDDLQQQAQDRAAARLDAVDPPSLEREILALRLRVSDALRSLHELDLRLEALGEQPQHAEFIDRATQHAADVQAGELLTVAATIEASPVAPGAVPEPAYVALLAQRSAVAEALTQTVTVLALRELPTAEYRRTLIGTTGEITSDILDFEVSSGLMKEWWAEARHWVFTSSPAVVFKLLMFMGILAVSWLFGRLARAGTRRAVAGTELTQLAKDFATTAASRVVVALGFLVGLSQLGVDVTALVAGLGVAGVVIGFALQDTLSNFASGVMILAYRPFDVGDRIVVAGDGGVVQAMTLVTTTLLTPDNQRVYIPNNKVWQNTIVNQTSESVRRVDLVVGVSYDADLDQVQRVLIEAVTALSTVVESPAPEVEVLQLGASSVDIAVRPWCRSTDYFDCSFEVTKAVKQRLDLEGIEIPFPQRVVHARPS